MDRSRDFFFQMAIATYRKLYAHVCSTDPSCSLMGPRWLIYPILSYPNFWKDVIILK